MAEFIEMSKGPGGIAVVILAFLFGRVWPWLTRTLSTRETREFELEKAEREADRQERARMHTILDGYAQALQHLNLGVNRLVERLEHTLRAEAEERQTLRDERLQMTAVLDKFAARLGDLGTALTTIATRLEHLERHADVTDRNLAVIADYCAVNRRPPANGVAPDVAERNEV
jgi:chromosome segregation ATPase